MAAFDRNSKPDTRLLCIRAGGGAAALAVDQSQWASDLTNNTTYLTSTDAELGITYPREIAIVAKIANTSSGYLVNLGNVAGTVYNYRVEAAGATARIRFHHNSSTDLATVTLPNVGASVRTYLIHWSTYYSVADATYASEFAVCDIASNTWNFDRKTHSVPISFVAGYQFNMSGYGAGVVPFSGGLSNIESVRLSNNYHSTAHAQEDWVSESSAPTTVGYVPPLELIPVAQGTMFVDEDGADQVNRWLLTSGGGGYDPSYAGPAELVGAISAEANKYRLWSPLLNVHVNTPPTLQNTYLPANFYSYLSGDTSGHRYGLNHFYVRPVPPGANLGRVRVFVQTWIAGGAPFGTSVSLSLRMISYPKRPTGYPLPWSGFGATAAVVCTTDHLSTGVGEWIELGELDIRVGVDGFTWLALGILFGSGTGNTYLRAKIKGICVDPYTE